MATRKNEAEGEPEREDHQRAAAEARRLVEFLGRLVRLSDRTTRSLEVQLGLGHSSVSKLLTGYVRPNLTHLLLIASALGLEPDEFFALAYPRRRRNHGPLFQQVVEIERRAEDEALAPLPVQPPADAELQGRVEKALRDMLLRLAQSPSSVPGDGE